MKAGENNYVEIEEWIVKVINSCTTIGQIVKSRKIIDLYLQKLSNETKLSRHAKKNIKENLIEHYKNTKLELIRNQE